HLCEALDQVRKSEYGRLAGRDRRYIKGQKYTLPSRRENLTLDGKKALKTLLFGQQAAQHGLCPQGEVRSVVELRAVRAGRGASSRTGAPVSSGSGSSRTRSSPI